MECSLKGKRWERRKDARPQELLAAALDLFVERGFSATRLDDVAARAGVSKGTLYLYFTSKEDLFKAVVQESMIPLIGEAEDLIDKYQGHTAILFRHMILGWWERGGKTKVSGITKLMMAESGNFPEVAKFYYEEVISRIHRLIIRMLEHGIAQGDFRAINTKEAMHVVVAPMVMLMLWQHSFGACRLDDISPEAFLQAYFDIFLHGLLKDPAAPIPDGTT